MPAPATITNATTTALDATAIAVCRTFDMSNPPLLRLSRLSRSRADPVVVGAVIWAVLQWRRAYRR